MTKTKVVQSRFYTASEVAQIMGCSRPTAYKVIQKLNERLKEQGKITLAGKISKRFFDESI